MQKHGSKREIHLRLIEIAQRLGAIRGSILTQISSLRRIMNEATWLAEFADVPGLANEIGSLQVEAIQLIEEQIMLARESGSYGEAQLEDFESTLRFARNNLNETLESSSA